MERFMKKVFGFYTKVPLILRIAVGLTIGIVLGLFVPQADFVTVFGTEEMIKLLTLRLTIH